MLIERHWIRVSSWDKISSPLHVHFFIIRWTGSCRDRGIHGGLTKEYILGICWLINLNILTRWKIKLWKAVQSCHQIPRDTDNNSIASLPIGEIHFQNSIIIVVVIIYAVANMILVHIDRLIKGELQTLRACTCLKLSACEHHTCSPRSPRSHVRLCRTGRNT